ncbi:hypothetical protein IWX90DRAFT_482135 [Phyllosticta citrichinensis]|uniref:DUF7598 domain-containing protein n=1 Tax=Phyllosticta citrichinensis TaxID=1130410 RepID=A0ABR1Y5Y4_9PEZI
MSLFSIKNLAGPGYILLNIFRLLNILVLLAVSTSSVVVVVKTIIRSNQYYFFDLCGRVITALIALFLVVSELSVFRKYFVQNWPLLSYDHGFVVLGLAMITMGVNLLGSLNKEINEATLGTPFFRLVLSSGIVSIAVGFFNIGISFIFRDRKLRISARRVRAHGVVALQDAEAQREMEHAQKTLSVKTSMNSVSNTRTPMPYQPRTPTPTAAAAVAPEPPTSNSLFRSARASLFPNRYAENQYTNDVSDAKSTKSAMSKKAKKTGFIENISGPLNISPPVNGGPINRSPEFERLRSTVQKPDLTHHPSMRALRRENNPYELSPTF